MALLLPQCGPELASIRQRLLSSAHQHRARSQSQFPARATHGTTESSTKASASSSPDHLRIPSSEPCCNLVSPLVMAPRKPTRRSSRLRARRGRDDAKTADTSDADAAEWISRVLANNGVVEVDPVTMAEQMQYHAKRETEPADSQYHSASLSSSSEVSDSFAPRGPGFPHGFPRVPLGVALAAGSAVALAIFAVLIQSLNRHSDRTASRKSDSEGNNLASGFTGEPVSRSNGSPQAPQSPRGNKLPKEVLASGAGLFSKFQSERNKPVPPSPSKGENPQQKQQQERNYSSVAPFFASDSSPATDSRPAPSISKWPEEKYNSVTPFFASDGLTTRTETVTPFFPDERGIDSNKKTGNGSSASENVTPFFADEKQGSQTSNGPSVENIKPFFADEQGSRGKSGSSLENVSPFFADEQGNRGKSGSSLENVSPFFADEQGSKRKSGSSLETVTPFFADEQGNRGKSGSSLENVSPFFADEQGSRGKSGSSFETVTPFFADEQGSKRKSGPSFETVTPFFADEQGSRGKSGSSLENVSPFFADEQQGRSSTGKAQSSKLETVPPFFPDDRVARSGSAGEQAQRDSLAEFTAQRRTGAEQVVTRIPGNVLSGPLQSEGKEILAEIAGKSQGQHKEFLEGSIEERLTGDGFAFKGEGAPSVEVEKARVLSPEELALLDEIKAEEERRYAKMRALQSAFPALAIGAGAVGALVGVDGAFQMVGLTATASFISYELLWANKRQELLDEISRITDHHKLFRFLQKRKIVKDDC